MIKKIKNAIGNLVNKNNHSTKCIINEKVVVYYCESEGKIRTVDCSHPLFESILNAVKANASEQEIITLFDNPIEKYAELSNITRHEGVEIVDGKVLYNGEPLHNSLTTTIQRCLSEKISYIHLIRFYEKLMKNPDSESINNLYDYIMRNNITISEDGDLLLYKKVRSDYRDYFTGTIDNSIGKEIKEKREEICNDRNVNCGKGYHAGSMKYADIHYHSGQGRIVLVQVDPADVVSVPIDYNCSKIRICRYKVIADVESEINKTVISVDGDESKVEKVEIKETDKFGTPWEEWEIKHLKKNYKNKTYAQIAKEVGRSENAVRKCVKRQGWSKVK